MTAALELTRAARAPGARAAFVATGQTGIMIAGWGIAIDRVIADFASGAAEQLVVAAAANADLVFVEGQGGINHPAFAPVTLALLYGCGARRARARARSAAKHHRRLWHAAARLSCADPHVRGPVRERQTGAGRRRRAQHARARRAGGARSDRDRGAMRRACRLTTSFASAPERFYAAIAPAIAARRSRSRAAQRLDERRGTVRRAARRAVASFRAAARRRSKAPARSAIRGRSPAPAHRRCPKSPTRSTRCSRTPSRDRSVER